MAQLRLIPANPENTRVHNPLGSQTDLARHLILSPVAVPAP